VPATPPETLTRARHIAQAEGINYVYTGNVHDRDGGTTFCPACRASLVVRDWHRILDYRVTEAGQCPDCGTAIAGRFGKYEGAFGQRRIPLHLGA